MHTPEPVPIDPGLLDRFLEAERGIEWRVVISPPKRAARRATSKGKPAPESHDAQLAYYHDETARIERHTAGTEDILTVTSGPVGALVLVAECARRGMPRRLETRLAGDLPEFPEGAIEARWSDTGEPSRPGLPFKDVVQLARYALV